MSGSVVLAYDYPLLGVFWTTFWLFLWMLWFFLLFHVVIDVFRDDALSGWAKAGWIVFVLVLPFLGILIYVATRGRGMGRREAMTAQARQEALGTYARRTGEAETARRTTGPTK